MSAAAGAAAGAASRAIAVSRAQRGFAPEGSLALRLAAFAALAGFAASHWIGFVSDPPGGRAIAVIAIALACGAALAASARLPGPAVARVAIRVAIVLAALAAGLLATGLHARLLVPSGWDQLGEGLDRGLIGTRGADWPYAGVEPWVRLTVLLGLPALLVPAAALAFWPVRRAPGPLRLTALGLLVILYAVPVTERSLGNPVWRGTLLLLLAAAWLWLPRLRRRDAIPAAVALVAAGALAMPVAAGLSDTKGWIAYESWSLFNDRGHGRSTAFDWTHDYGPITWPRTGATLLQVRSEEPHYWKAETLEHFDGLRWRHTNAQTYDPAAELPPNRPRQWEERIGFTVRALRSRLVVGAGTIHAVGGGLLTAESGDGTVELVDGELRRGDSYSILAYVPEPTPRQMRAAPREFPSQFLFYTSLELPLPGESALVREPGVGAPQPERAVVSAFPGDDPGVDPAQRRRIMASPYRETYLLARRLAAGQPTTYDVVQNVERHLERGYVYNERPTPRSVPLDAFLFRDRAGYCQQFSGAMALLLRMNGIPARVAGGFAPGIEDTTTGEFRVRDMDAHSWVEVFFRGIGWVTFDPTPSASPATAQEGDDPTAAGGAAGADGADTGASAKQRKDADLSTPGAPGTGNRRRLWLAAAAASLPLLGIAALWGVALLRARRLRQSGGDPDLRELVLALERLGRPPGPGTTLLALESRLAATAGPAAADYARALRDRRFAPAGAAEPRLDRRALRRALTRGRGPRTRLRALLALPPRQARFGRG